MTFKFTTMYLVYLHTKAIIRIIILISTIYFIVDINMNGIGLERKSSISIRGGFRYVVSHGRNALWGPLIQKQ